MSDIRNVCLILQYIRKSMQLSLPVIGGHGENFPYTSIYFPFTLLSKMYGRQCLVFTAAERL